jgi:PAS domain S-box-containing protein
MKTSPDSPLSPTAVSAKRSSTATSLSRAFSLQPSALHSLLEQLPDAILFLDPDFRITFANAQARLLSRLTEDDINHKTLWEIFPQTRSTELETRTRRAMAGLAENFEYHYAPFDIWVDIHVFPIEGGVAFYYREITDRKRAEAARDEAARKLRQVFESAPDSIVCIDRDWNCTFANLTARIILKTKSSLVPLKTESSSSPATSPPARRQNPAATSPPTSSSKSSQPPSTES